MATLHAKEDGIKDGLKLLLRYISLNDNIASIFESSGTTITLSSKPFENVATIEYLEDDADGNIETKTMEFTFSKQPKSADNS